MTRPLPKSLLIPVETLNREFDAKLLLALVALAKGFAPIIGNRRTMHDHLHKLPASIYFAKGIRTGNRLIMSILERLGHIIVAQDEEALLRISDEALLMMLDDETFNRPRLLYAWGPSNARAWKKFSGYRGTPVLETGNPRMDMLRPELRGFFSQDIARLEARYGRFVLFSSNFSLVNHYIKGHVRFRFASGASAQKALDFKSGIHAHKKLLFEHFKTALPQIARAIAPHNLVIRPHPSENHQAWQSAVAGLDNAHVVHEGPIAPWLAACHGLLHNGCTTAVEAVVMGKPAFSYRPVTSDAFDARLPNGLSRQFDSLPDLIAALVARTGDDSAGAELNGPTQALLDDNIASLQGSLCCEKIVASLPGQRARLCSGPMPSRRVRTLALAHHFARRGVRAITGRRKTAKNSAGYLAHKFPGIARPDVDERIARLVHTLPQLVPARARRLAPDIFAIERKT